ncbi:MAG: hypothetical protein LIO44_03085 [Eubacterium sp.]|nr:hypothetical protein [Eubacterium sp.]
MKKRILKRVGLALCFAALFTFTKNELNKNISEQFTPEDIMNDDSAGGFTTSAFDSRYDLGSASLDVNSLDFSDVTSISSADEWENYVNNCIAKEYHYMFFEAPSDMTFNLDKIMKTSQVTAITIYTMSGGDAGNTVTGYNFTYTYSHDILAAVSTGSTGNLDTKMKAALEVATNFVSGLSGSDYDKELAIHNFVCSKINYTNDSSNSDITNCYGGLVLGTGNCQAYADSFDLLCGLAGLTTGRIGCTANGAEHSLNYVRLDGQYYFVDCTFDDGISDLERGFGLFYFNVPYTVISQDHSFDYVPFAHSQALNSYNYYLHNNIYADSASSLAQAYANIASSSSSGEILFDASNGDAALTDIFTANLCGYTNISTQKFTFGSYQIIKFELS